MYACTFEGVYERADVIVYALMWMSMCVRPCMYVHVCMGMYMCAHVRTCGRICVRVYM